MGIREPKESLQRSIEAWKIKDFWRSIHEECYDLALAGVSPYVADKKLPRVMNRQFDSTGPNAVMRLANRLLNDLTPMHEEWINVMTGPVLKMQLKKPQLDELKKQIDGVSLMANMVVNQGEMVAARHASFLDLVISGMGVMLTLEAAGDDVNPANSQCVSQAEVAIEKDARGRNVGIFRKRKIKVREISPLWDDAVIPKVVSEMEGEGKDPEIEVLEVTYSNEAVSIRGKNVPAWSYEVLYVADGKDPHLMVERGYNENPWTILQWMTLPGCPYGPGPVMLALADIRTSNKIVEMILQNAALALAGMYMVRDDGTINADNIQITNGGLIPVGSTGGTMGASIVPLETGRNFDISQLLLDEYQTRIKKWLYDNGLPALDATPRSATEIINRVRELTQDLGAGIGRVSGDLVDYVRRIIGILVRSGVIPFKINIDQFTFKVQINSPLARAAHLQKVETVIQWMQMILSIGGPQLLMLVAKLPEIAAWIAEQMGVPTDLVFTEDERTKNQNDMATVQAAGAMPDQAGDAMPQQA